MNTILKIISIVIFVMILLSGCTNQINTSSGQNFDQLKAAKTRVSLGLTYLKNGNFSQAKFNLDKALEFAPSSADVNFAMAYYYQSVSELEQAENAYQFAMELEPNNANIANSYGAFLCQNSDYENAKKYFLKAVNTSSFISSAETYENLALCSLRQGKTEDAIQYLRSAVNHQPRRANSLFLLVSSLVETRQWQEAKVFFRRYEKTSQISSKSLLLAIKIEMGVGDNSAAKGYYDMLLEILPDDPAAKAWLTNHQSTLKIIKNINKPRFLTKTTSELVESQSTEKLSDTTLPLPTNNVSIIIKQNTNISKDDIAVVESEDLDLPVFHIVTKGDNLYRISLLYNIKMQRLIDWNSLVDASAIFDGKKLSLVAPSVVE
jgi:type IV pilus assembly protein PilF